MVKGVIVLAFAEPKPRRRSRIVATQVFWVVLFLDICWLFFQYGGLAVTDLLVHGSFLLVATIALFCERDVRRIPVPWLILFGLPLLIGLVQMIRVSPDLLVYLNPVKSRIGNQVLAVFPDLALSREITMMPGFHRFNLTLLAMDIYLALLLLMANRPSRTLVFGFVHGLALILGFLNILAQSDRLQGISLLSRFEGTYGGLVNPNHFATLSAIFLVFLLGFLFIKTHKILRSLLNPSARQTIFEELGWVAITVLCLGLTMISFRSVYSRSGLVTLLLMLLVLVGFGLWHMSSGVNRRLRLGIWAGLVLGGLLFFPLGRGIDKFAEKALDNLRLTQFKIGLDYLAEKPWLGVGLGATKSILHPIVPRETVYDLRLSTDFHNEYLQIAVEYGVLGVVAIFSLLAALLWLLFPRKRHKNFSSKMIMITVWCMIAGLAFHSMISFPLRVTALRVFAMVMVGYALKLNGFGRKRSSPRTRLVLMAGGLLVILASLALGHFPASKHASPEPGSLAHKAYRYGNYYQMVKYQANDQLQEALNYLGDIEGLRTRIAATRNRYQTFLAEQPFSLQVLNGIFMLDVIEYRLDHPDFDARQFAAWEARVEAINRLGKNRNINARLAKFFLYANFLDHLDASQMSYYETLKTELAFRYRDAEEKAEDLVPAN